VPSSKRTKSRLAAEPTLQSREITRDELARLIGSLPPDVRITIEFHVRSGNPVLTDPEKPLTIAQAAEALNVFAGHDHADGGARMAGIPERGAT
jgi:hypothetical protein